LDYRQNTAELEGAWKPARQKRVGIARTSMKFIRFFVTKS